MQKWRKAQYDLEQARKAVGQLQKEIGAKMKVRALVGSRCVPPDGARADSQLVLTFENVLGGAGGAPACCRGHAAGPRAAS
jgi:hypothetical protein